MGISSEQLSKLQKKIVKKIAKETGTNPSEVGSCTRFDELTCSSRAAIMEVAKKVCKKFAEKRSLTYNECSSRKFLMVEGVTVVGVYKEGERVTVFDF